MYRLPSGAEANLKIIQELLDAVKSGHEVPETLLREAEFAVTYLQGYTAKD